MLNEGEHQQQDFKFRVDDARKIARTLVAFANTDGGRLLIGVKDNGKVVGVNAEEDFYVAEAAARVHSKPEIIFQTRLWDYEGKTVIEFYVPPSNCRPHMAMDEDGKWQAYIRQNDRNILAQSVILKVWKLGFQRKPETWQYSQAEQLLFRYLKENSSISLSKFQKIGRIRRDRAENSLARLVSWGILEMQHHDGVLAFLPAGEEPFSADPIRFEKPV